MKKSVQATKLKYKERSLVSFPLPLQKNDKSRVKWLSHGKLELANSCWHIQDGVCKRHKYSGQILRQTVGDK